MKKLLAALLVGLLATAVFAGEAEKEDTATAPAATTEATTTEAATTETAPATETEAK
ncbi:hypothetical protein [Rugosibacter aromaticivorans]|uniref:hypothetical protein n=1 Tax=Rugosibacter aromaticivorans TaxID=1565605 RepID=UPI00192A6431|nr:hypothetical protein [Rugosibacter aromaticivorans]